MEIPPSPEQKELATELGLAPDTSAEVLHNTLACLLRSVGVTPDHSNIEQQWRDHQDQIKSAHRVQSHLHSPLLLHTLRGLAPKIKQVRQQLNTSSTDTLQECLGAIDRRWKPLTDAHKQKEARTLGPVAKDVANHWRETTMQKVGARLQTPVSIMMHRGGCRTRTLLGGLLRQRVAAVVAKG
jgi:hypothetical protein